eukprot:877103-Rhodomonas_salina.1
MAAMPASVLAILTHALSWFPKVRDQSWETWCVWHYKRADIAHIRAVMSVLLCSFKVAMLNLHGLTS